MSGECGDAVFEDAPANRLPVAPRDRLRLVFSDNPNIRDRPEKVRASLVHVADFDLDFTGWSEKAHRVGDGPWRWRVRLPDRLHRANALYLEADFNGGSSDYLAGIKRR